MNQRMCSSTSNFRKTLAYIYYISVYRTLEPLRDANDVVLTEIHTFNHLIIMWFYKQRNSMRNKRKPLYLVVILSKIKVLCMTTSGPVLHYVA